MKIVEERNRLIKVRIYKQGNNQWRLLPVEKKDGSKIRRGEITFRGDEEAFRKLLMRLKAKDVETDPPSVKGKTYQQMIDTAKDGSDPYIWVWLTIWNKYRNDNKLTIAEKETGFITSRHFLEKHLENFLNFYSKKVYTGSKANSVLTALDEYLSKNSLQMIEEDFDNLVAILENKYIMEDKKDVMKNTIKITEDVVITQKDGAKIILERGDTIRIVNERNEKKWKDMTDEEKRKAYEVAIESGDVGDTFEGFSKSMWRSTFDVDTGEQIEVR